MALVLVSFAAGPLVCGRAFDEARGSSPAPWCSTGLMASLHYPAMHGFFTPAWLLLLSSAEAPAPCPAPPQMDPAQMSKTMQQFAKEVSRVRHGGSGLLSFANAPGAWPPGLGEELGSSWASG